MLKIISAFCASIIFFFSAGGSHAQSWEFSNNYEYGFEVLTCAAHVEVKNQGGRPDELAFAFDKKSEPVDQIRILASNLVFGIKVHKASLEFLVDGGQPITFEWELPPKTMRGPTFRFSYENNKGTALLAAMARGSHFTMRYTYYFTKLGTSTEVSDTKIFEGGLSGSGKALTALDSCAKQYLPRKMVCGAKPVFANLKLKPTWNGTAPTDMAHLSQIMRKYKNDCQYVESFFKKWKYGYEGCLRDKRVSDRHCDQIVGMQNDCRRDLRYVIGSYEERFTKWSQCTKRN